MRWLVSCDLVHIWIMQVSWAHVGRGNLSARVGSERCHHQAAPHIEETILPEACSCFREEQDPVSRHDIEEGRRWPQDMVLVRQCMSIEPE